MRAHPYAACDGEMAMTKREFFKLLRQTPRTWRLIPSLASRDGRTFQAAFLRCNNEGGDCPVTAVYRLRSRRHRLVPAQYSEAAERIGLLDTTAQKIADAADDIRHAKLRAELLRACGLSK